MIDFEVPLNRGWFDAFEKKHGEITDAAQAVSPGIIRSYEQLEMNAEALAKPQLRVAETKAPYHVERKTDE